MNPKVSIIIPTYQSLGFLPQLVASLKCQVFQDWQALFVDDGSEDGTIDFLKNVSRTDQRFWVIEHPHGGNPTVTRNIGMQQATTEFVAMLDHDDYWHPLRLQEGLRAFERFPSASVVHTDRIEVLGTQRASYPQLESGDQSLSVGDALQELLYANKVTNSSVLFRKSLLEKVGYLNENLLGVDDYHLLLKLAKQGPFVHIHLPLTYVCMHDNNLSKKRMVMADNLFHMVTVMEHEGFAPQEVQIIRGQAQKAKAIAMLKIKPSQSLKLLLKSFWYRPQFKTLLISVLCLLVLLCPPVSQVRWVKSL